MGSSDSFVRISPEPFDPVDAGRPSLVFIVALVYSSMILERLVQAIVAWPGIRVDRGINGDSIDDNVLQGLCGHILDRLNIDEPIRSFINPEDGLLKGVGAPSTLNLAGLSKLLLFASSTVAKAGPKVGFVNFDFTV